MERLVSKIARIARSAWTIFLDWLFGTEFPIFNDYQMSCDAYNRRAFNHAFKRILSLAEQGNIWAQCHVAGLYRYGSGVQRNCVKAVKWLKLAAEQGDTGANYKLGCIYYRGEGSEKDFG